jgi:hypothetical protein
MKLSSGKLQFWEWEKTLVVPEHFVPRPYWYFTFLHAGNVSGMEECKIAAWARDNMSRKCQKRA